ncbi:MAG: hypothetical protein GXX91_05785 [Verrucomicrobiaceae bacterium]|nr:hypothetical protein [Verrucomicrobiaceae bacterium]
MDAAKLKAAEVEEQKATLQTRTNSLAKATEEVSQLEQSIQKLQDEAATLQTTKIDLDAKLVEGEANQKTLDANLVTAKADLEKAKTLMGDVVLIEGIQKEMLQIRTQIEESEIELTQLEGAVAAAQVDRERLAKVAAELEALRVDQQAGVIRGEFQSTIKKAYNQWGFVVVNGGNDQGVVNRAQLDVYRRGQPICRLLVTSVEPNESAADIIAGSLAPGQTVQVGDTVVKSVRAQTPAVVPTSAPAAGAATPATAPSTPAAPAPTDGAAPAAADPFGGGAMEGGAAPAAPAEPDPFGGGTMEGGAAPAAPAAPAEPDPFGSTPAPEAGADTPAPATPATPAAPDPFQ